MTKIEKILGCSAAVALILTAFGMECSHAKRQAQATAHEDERTWRAVDTVRAEIRKVKADTDTLKLLIRNFVWVIVIGGLYV